LPSGGVVLAVVLLSVVDPATVVVFVAVSFCGRPNMFPVPSLDGNKDNSFDGADVVVGAKEGMRDG
jgi:hypothetical protein